MVINISAKDRFDTFEPECSVCPQCLVIIAGGRVKELDALLDLIHARVMKEEWFEVNAIMDSAARRLLEVQDLREVISDKNMFGVEEVTPLAVQITSLFSFITVASRAFGKIRAYLMALNVLDVADVVQSVNVLAYRWHVRRIAEAEAALVAAWQLLDIIEEWEGESLEHAPCEGVAGSLIFSAVKLLNEIDGEGSPDDVASIREMGLKAMSRAGCYMGSDALAGAEGLRWVGGDSIA